MNPAVFLDTLLANPEIAPRIVHVEHLPARPASYSSLETPLPQALASLLATSGYTRFYTHQAEAIDAARRGKSVVIATATSSGKSLCYHVPTLEAIGASTKARALYLFPTKALAQDQARSLRSIAPGIPVATFDGDTPAFERTAIRKNSRIVITNPDMLHLGILPHHQSWSTFLRNLRIVVIDETHIYRGIFGSHVANIIRRLRRLCSYYGSDPVFIASSATIANPGEHVFRLTGIVPEVVSETGAPTGERHFVFWNPPLIGGSSPGRKGANPEAADLLTGLVRSSLRTIVFAKTRRMAELIATYSRNSLKHDDRRLDERIATYRAGYLATDRRVLEQRLFTGDLIGVTATTALELGIDVGDLQATVLTGYPGSIASTWQQAGRAGRGTTEALTVLIGLDNPLDQYLMRHPELVFQRPSEHARIHANNPRILLPHILAAAHELPIGMADLDVFGDELLGASQDLTDQGLLRRRDSRYFVAPTIDYPAALIDIRSASNIRYDLVLEPSGRVIETIDGDTALFQLYPGAVYIHQGQNLLIQDLDLTTRVARASLKDVPYYTQTEDFTELSVLQTTMDRDINGVTVSFGDVKVSTRVVGYKRKRQFTDEVVSREILDLPPVDIETQGLWWTVPEPLIRAMIDAGLDPAGGLHAAEHACIGLLPLLALCDRQDIGGLSTLLHMDTDAATIFIYDGHAGGAGIAERGYLDIETLWGTTLQLLEECPCEDGCPGCVQSPKCGNNNTTLDKAAARMLLRLMIGQSLPNQPTPRTAAS